MTRCQILPFYRDRTPTARYALVDATIRPVAPPPVPHLRGRQHARGFALYCGLRGVAPAPAFVPPSPPPPPRRQPTPVAARLAYMAAGALFLVILAAAR